MLVTANELGLTQLAGREPHIWRVIGQNTPYMAVGMTQLGPNCVTPMNKKKSGRIALAFFPATSMQQVKLRPVLLLRQLLYGFDDWLICMVSSKTQNYIKGLDDLIN
jgi:hypothetical protein